MMLGSLFKRYKPLHKIISNVVIHELLGVYCRKLVWEVPDQSGNQTRQVHQVRRGRTSVSCRVDCDLKRALKLVYSSDQRDYSNESAATSEITARSQRRSWVSTAELGFSCDVPAFSCDVPAYRGDTADFRGDIAAFSGDVVGLQAYILCTPEAALPKVQYILSE